MGSVTISSNDYKVFSETADPVADAKKYLVAKIGADAWIDAEKDDQRKALVSATRWVLRSLAARLVNASDIPDPATTPANTYLAQATYESAFVLVSTPTAQDQQSTGNNLKRLKAGSAEFEYFRPVSGGILPTIAQSLILQYIGSLGLVTGFGAFASGTDGVSEFTDQDRFGRIEGFP